MRTKKLATALLVSTGGYVGVDGIKIPQMALVKGILPPDGEHKRGRAYVSAQEMRRLGFTVGDNDDFDYVFFYTASKTQRAEIRLVHPDSYYERYGYEE